MKLKVRRARGLNKYFGLMFRSRKTKPLLFEFNKDVNFAIHSWFVFFDFNIVWLDKNNNILEKKKVKPFTSIIRSSKPFRKFIEIPL